MINIKGFRYSIIQFYWVIKTKAMNAKIFTLIMLLAVFSGVAQEDTQKLIDQLSVDEKIYLSIGTGMDIPGTPAGTEAPQAATSNSYAGVVVRIPTLDVVVSTNKFPVPTSTLER